MIAKVAQLVEHDLAKVGVAGSSPVFRSKRCPDGGMVDTKDLKSFGFTAVGVQVPLRVHKKGFTRSCKPFFYHIIPLYYKFYITLQY